MVGHNAQQHVWKKPNTACQHKHLMPAAKYSGRVLVIGACSAATGPGHLAIIESAINSSVYQSIPESNMWPSVWLLKLVWKWVTQQDNDPKHSSKSTTECLKKKIIKALQWSSQSPDLSLTVMLYTSMNWSNAYEPPLKTELFIWFIQRYI